MIVITMSCLGHAFLESYEILLSPMATDGRCGQTEQLYSSSRVRRTNQRSQTMVGSMFNTSIV